MLGHLAAWALQQKPLAQRGVHAKDVVLPRCERSFSLDSITAYPKSGSKQAFFTGHMQSAQHLGFVDVLGIAAPTSLAGTAVTFTAVAFREFDHCGETSFVGAVGAASGTARVAADGALSAVEVPVWTSALIYAAAEGDCCEAYARQTKDMRGLLQRCVDADGVGTKQAADCIMWEMAARRRLEEDEE